MLRNPDPMPHGEGTRLASKDGSGVALRMSELAAADGSLAGVLGGGGGNEPARSQEEEDRATTLSAQISTVFQAQLATVMAITTLAFGLFSYQGRFQDPTLRDTAALASITVTVVATWFLVLTEREYSSTVRKTFGEGRNEERYRSMMRWRPAPLLIAGAVSAAGISSIVRYFRVERLSR